MEVVEDDLLGQLVDLLLLAQNDIALLLDGASARTQVTDSNAFATAAAIAAVLVDAAITAGPSR